MVKWEDNGRLIKEQHQSQLRIHALTRLIHRAKGLMLVKYINRRCDVVIKYILRARKIFWRNDAAN